MSCRTSPEPQTSLLDAVLPTQKRPSCKAYVGVTNLKIPSVAINIFMFELYFLFWDFLHLYVYEFGLC